MARAAARGLTARQISQPAIDADLLRRAPSCAGAFDCVSKARRISPMTVDDYLIDNEPAFSDTDHWSAKGQEVFGARLLDGSEALRRLVGTRSGDDATAAGRSAARPWSLRRRNPDRFRESRHILF